MIQGANTAGKPTTVRVKDDGTTLVEVSNQGRGGSNIASAQVAVGTSSALLVAARTNRQEVLLSSSAPFYIGPPGVTQATGMLIAANAYATVRTGAAIYAVAAAAGTVFVLETY